MSEIPATLKYLDSHEWVRLDDDGTVIIGITEHAQSALGDVVFVELPKVGTVFNAGDQASAVESVKAASDIYCPVSGEIIAVNEELDDTPDLVNSEPYEGGWFFRVKPSNLTELDNMLSAEQYAKLIED